MLIGFAPAVEVVRVSAARVNLPTRVGQLWQPPWSTRTLDQE